jgi:hypothetical protein
MSWIRQPATADHAIWLATRFLDELAVDGRNGCFPADLARKSGMTKLEAQLALRMAVEIGFAVRRRDGRFYKKTERTK